MDLLKAYLEEQNNQTIQKQQFDTPLGSGLEILEKNYGDYVVLGSAQSYSNKGLTVQQKMRAMNLKLLFSMSPSANQSAEKVVTCVLSDGYSLRPKGNKKYDEKKMIEIYESLEEMKLINVMKNMQWSRMIWGDSWVYKVKGTGKYKDKIVDLVPLNNLGAYMDVDKDLYYNTGVLKINKYRYEIPFLEGSMSGHKIKVVEYAPEDIMRWSRTTSYNPLYGTAPLEEDQATLILGLKVLNHNLRFFGNSARPPIVVKMGKDSDYNKALEYKKVLDSKYKGSNNAWETMVTWGDTDIQEIKMPDSTQFYDMLTYVRIQVCGLIGVPPQEIGISDKSGLNNSETAHKDFIKTVVNEQKRELGELLTYQLLRKGMGIDDFEIYLPPMDAISEKQRADTNRVMIESGQMTINESRESLGKEIINESWAKTLLYGNTKGPKQLVPIDDVLDNTPQTGGSSAQDRRSNSGRPDLEGRINDTNATMNV